VKQLTGSLENISASRGDLEKTARLAITEQSGAAHCAGLLIGRARGLARLVALHRTARRIHARQIGVGRDRIDQRAILIRIRLRRIFDRVRFARFFGWRLRGLDWLF
jgi:hypothetical protein